MDDLASLQERIKTYADYADEDSRTLADQQVRAYVGECLWALRDRLAPDGAPGEQLEALLFRCEFTDQRVIRAIDHLKELESAVLGRVRGLDRSLVDAADRSTSIEAAELAAYLTELGTLFDARATALVSPGS